jgi:hypothetical protein
MAVFAYNCVTSFFMVSNSLENPTVKRLRAVFASTFSMIFCVIFITGVAGWITFGKAKDPKNDLIIFRSPLGDTDKLMTIGRFVLVLSLVIFGGLKISPMKPMIFKVFKM